MKIAQLTACLLVLTVVSCRKERVCECKNTYSTYDAGTIEQTKGKAKKYCQSLSIGQTTCYLK